jgi:antitoxin VapB
MAMNIKSPEAEALARRLAEATGETLTAAIITALHERLAKLDRRKQHVLLADQLNEIALRAAALPVLDSRTPEELIGYNENGIPR